MGIEGGQGRTGVDILTATAIIAGLVVCALTYLVIAGVVK
jgi:hypothetical protein